MMDESESETNAIAALELDEFNSHSTETSWHRKRQHDLMTKIFILFVVVAILLSIWFLLTSIVINPIETYELVDSERMKHNRDRTNMSILFANALYNLNQTD